MATKAEVTQVLVELAAGYPNFLLSAESTRAYVTDLIEIDRKSLAEAAIRLRRSSKFFPAISEIRGLGISIMEERARRRAVLEQRRLIEEKPDQDDPRILECRRKLRKICSEGKDGSADTR
jgi:hypothetical protein